MQAPPAQPDANRRRLAAAVGCAFALGAMRSPAWARGEAAGRRIAPRGPLSADEQNNVAVFRAASPAVVNITALTTSRDFFSLDMQQVPAGVTLIESRE
jgi:hypothetical protein